MRSRDPAVLHALPRHGDRRVLGGAPQHDLRRRRSPSCSCAIASRAAVAQRAHRPAARRLAGRRRPRADPGLRQVRPDRRMARRPRHPGHLRATRAWCSRRCSSRCHSSSARSRRCSRRSGSSRSRRRGRSAPAAARRSARVTLPAIRWALAYGVVLTLARSLGEYGAVAVVSGRLIGKTQTATLHRRGAVPELRPDHGVCRVVTLAIVAIVIADR